MAGAIVHDYVYVDVNVNVDVNESERAICYMPMAESWPLIAEHFLLPDQPFERT